jgi:hypothetical protein
VKNFKKISFLSLTFGWIGLIITHAIGSNISFENASDGDTGVIIFWASFFLLIFYCLFILIPKKKIVKLAEKLNLAAFTILTALYGLTGFIALIGWLFINSEFLWIFLDAFIGAVIFGFSFHILWNRYKERFRQNHIYPILSLPLIFLFIYLFAYPKLFPSHAYKFVPDYIREDIIIRTIPKFKVGDNIALLQKALPGEFVFDNCRGGRTSYLEGFQFVIEVNCCKIVRLEYGIRQKSGYTSGPPRPCL